MKKLMLICTLILFAFPARAFTQAECLWLAQRIEATNPNASPQEKFYALKYAGCVPLPNPTLAQCQWFAQRIEASMPNASPREKFYALRAAGCVPG
jgi:hypothetical protein